MFSGIVEELGKIISITSSSVQIQAQKALENTKIGDSIAVNGVCLTVTKLQPHSFHADIAPETMKRSNLKKLTTGSPVNLEKSLRYGDPVGGHFVQGHIDTTAKVHHIKQEGNAYLVTFTLPQELTQYIVQKGYIAVDGMSLTIISPQKNNFTVSFIPHTFACTVAKNYCPGTEVNIEVDILGKYVEKMLAKSPAGITQDFLEKHGF